LASVVLPSCGHARLISGGQTISFDPLIGKFDVPQQCDAFTRKGGDPMSIISRGFSGRRNAADVELPPGQYLTTDFPVLSAGPTPRVPLHRWEFTIDDGIDALRRWDWTSFRDLPAETFTVDLHCVTRWSKLGTSWEGVSLDTMLADVDTDADYALVRSYGGYTTNLPLNDLMNNQGWIAFRFEEEDLAPEHGGPARLLVPHLYLWKSAKWVRGITLMHEDQPGFWETLGYHNYGDPWREQRYWGD
jgi:DMSO/TMAO reductase YedYZ molybdopterin-dependent catalytic subunit